LDTMGLPEAVKLAERFTEFLEDDDKKVFEEMLKDAQVFTPQANKIVHVSARTEFPLVFAILFAHHRKLTRVEKEVILGKG